MQNIFEINIPSQYYNSDQVFAWNFIIGGYQRALNWLKDHNGRNITNEKIDYYQKIVIDLTETNGLMTEINKILI